MRKLAYLVLVLALAAGASFAGPGAAKQETFTGEIGDSMCGLKHMMAGGAKACTDECVEAGSKYVLADAANNKVYELSDQAKPKEFAGQKVKVTGTLKGKTIQVASIVAAN